MAHSKAVKRRCPGPAPPAIQQHSHTMVQRAPGPQTSPPEYPHSLFRQWEINDSRGHFAPACLAAYLAELGRYAPCADVEPCRPDKG